MRSLLALIAALVLWTAMAWIVTTVMEGGHVCSILSTVDGNGQTEQLTQAELDKLTHERCDRGPSMGGILLFGTGYVVIIAAFVVRADLQSQRSNDDQRT